MFDSINVNFRKNEGFLTSIPCIPIPEYGQSNAPLVLSENLFSCHIIFIKKIRAFLTPAVKSLIRVNDWCPDNRGLKYLSSCT